MTEVRRTEYELLLLWLSFVGLLCFAFYVAWHEGYLALLIASDKSKISVLIGLLYIVGLGHCARRIWFVASQTEATENLAATLQNKPEQLTSATQSANDNNSIAGAYLRDALKAQQGANDETGARGNLPEIYAGRIKGPSELGWFLADAMLKLGLLGTIIGFILMLGSVAETSSLDANTMQKILRQMSVGMGTALYTTLAGLLASVTLGAQFQLLERGADRLINRIVHLAEVSVLPKQGQD